MLSLEKRLSLLPWLAAAAMWLCVAAVLVLLYLLEPSQEMGGVVAILVPVSFVVLVPGMGGFVVCLLRLRRGRLDQSLLHDLESRLGGELHTGSFLVPLVRPRLLTTVDGVPLEVLLSPPIPRTSRPMALDPQRAIAEQYVDAASAALETEQSRLGTETWPQLELRLGVDLPFKMQLSNSPHLGALGSGLEEVTDRGDALAAFRILSDRPEDAVRLLSDGALSAALAAGVGFNPPWASQVILRPADSGRGAGLYLLTVAAPETTAERVAEAVDRLLEAARHPVWSA
jgi:hypothetical protein